MRTIEQNIEETKQYMADYLIPIVEQSNTPLEGNIFTVGRISKIRPEHFIDQYVNKQKNISKLLMNDKLQNVMEIGFNSGFSALLMLISNPNIKLTCFDLGEHSYVIPCYQKLKETFGDRINLILGDSRVILPTIEDKFDLIHIDGGHASDVAISDIENSYRLSHEGTILIMDDYEYNNLHNIWDYYTIQYNLKDIYEDLYYTPCHDIKMV